MTIWNRGRGNLKDDGASRRPTPARKETVRGRVPAYRLREDVLREYLERIFPQQENFYIQVSWRQIVSMKVTDYGISFGKTTSILKSQFN
jgi:hypothetical protein